VNQSIQKLENQTASKPAWFSFWIVVLGLVLSLLPNQSDAQDWIVSLERTHRALTGLDLQASGAQTLAQTPDDQRTEVFKKFLSDLLASDAFAQAQADAWMLDHFATVSDRLEATGWDTPSFRRWLIDRFKDNTPYDQFVRSQLVGTTEPSSLLATHAWYLAGQWSDYQIAEFPTPIESNLVRQFRTALESIERSEHKDWQRLVEQTQKLQTPKGANPVRDFWQSLRSWPTVAEQERVWTWPDPTVQEPSEPTEPAARSSELASKKTPVDFAPREALIVSNASKLRAVRPWTLVLVGSFPRELIEQPESVCIFEQSQTAAAHWGGSDRALRSFRMELSEGRLVVRLIHDARISCQVVRTQEALPADQTLHLAISNDGLGRSDSIRVVVDGVRISTKPDEVSSGCYKEIVSKESSPWRIGTSGPAGWRLEQAMLYRESLSIPEIQGLADALWIDDWNEIDQQVQTQWIEHYAMRIDPQWRYQRESRDHYASNLAAVRESQSMLPVLGTPDAPVFLVQQDRFPNTLVDLADRNLEISPSKVVETQANRWRIEAGQRLEPDSVARSEIRRVWKTMLRHSSKTHRAGDAGDTLDDSRVETLAIEFMRDWDRRKMVTKLIERLLQSDANGQIRP
jgi:hypothetical protein